MLLTACCIRRGNIERVWWRQWIPFHRRRPYFVRFADVHAWHFHRMRVIQWILWGFRKMPFPSTQRMSKRPRVQVLQLPDVEYNWVSIINNGVWYKQLGIKYLQYGLYWNWNVRGRAARAITIIITKTLAMTLTITITHGWIECRRPRFRGMFFGVIKDKLRDDIQEWIC